MALTERYVTSAGAGTHSGADEANAYSWAEMLTEINAGSGAGKRYNVKGAVTGGASDAISGSGTLTAPVIIRGYGTTPSDGYQSRTSGHGALVTTNMPTVAYASGNRLNITGSNVLLESLRITGSFAGNFLGTGPLALVACRIENAGNGGSVFAGGRAFLSDLVTTGSSSKIANGNSSTFYGCLLQFTGIACEAFNASFVLVNCVAIGGTYLVWLFHSAAAVTVLNCTGYGIATAMVYSGTATGSLQTLLMGNHCTDSGRFLDGGSGSVLRIRNRTRDNSNTDAGAGDWPDWFPVTTDTGGANSDYVDAGAGDLRLLATAAGVGQGPFGVDLGAVAHVASGGVILVED